MHRKASRRPSIVCRRHRSNCTARRFSRRWWRAAKADGHVDARERQLIEGEFSKLTGDAQLQGWLEAELNKPLDPADVSRAATTPEMAAEMYLASVLMVDEEHFMERAYLDELARQLKLDPALKTELEAQVKLQQGAS